MKRLSTRVKRLKNLGTTNRMHRYWKGTAQGRTRMKSFETEEKARAWAKEQKLELKSHELREHSPKKWQWHKKNARLA